MKVFILSSFRVVFVRNNEEVVSLPFTIGVVEYAVCFLLVSSCSPAFLDVSLETLGDAVVDHEPHVVLVNSHAKGNGGHNNLDIVPHPPLLNVFLVVIVELSMIVANLHLIVLL